MFTYEFLAQILYLGAAAIAACAALAVAAAGLRRLRPLVTAPVVGAAICVLGLQFILSVVAAGAFAMKQIQGIALIAVLANWLMVGCAVAILPGALVVEADLPKKGLTRPQLLAGIVLVLAIAAGMVVFDVLLGGIMEQTPMMDGLLDGPVSMILFLPLALVAAVVEEVIFRGGIQGLTERFLPRLRIGVPLAQRIAIVTASLVWAFGHAGMMLPNGVKETQIFLTGLVLGELRVRGGMRACIAAHLALNGSVLAVQLVGWLVTGDVAWNEV